MATIVGGHEVQSSFTKTYVPVFLLLIYIDDIPVDIKYIYRWGGNRYGFVLLIASSGIAHIINMNCSDKQKAPFCSLSHSHTHIVKYVVRAWNEISAQQQWNVCLCIYCVW